MDGVILLNKPVGMTSFSAVSKCRHIFQEKKAGHTGTLDPNASGLMIVLLGKYTKLVPYCYKDHKHYQAQFQLGAHTDTEDIWGTVTETKEPSIHTEEELQAACAQFIGQIKQIPPMYSALKKDGKKLYEYARKGEEVEREPRNVTIDSLSVKQIDSNRFLMDAVVSSGTYIRTLIVDYCNALYEYGTMCALERQGIGRLTLQDASSLQDIEEGRCRFIDPIEVIDPEWKLVECRMPEMVKSGRHVYLNEETSDKVIFVKEKELLAAYQKQEDQMYHCVRGLF